MQAATPYKALAEMTLATPKKVEAVKVEPAVVEEEPIEEYRTRFVGDVDLDEKDEPLLKESKRRFVLFPIQYHEVFKLTHLCPITFANIE